MLYSAVVPGVIEEESSSVDKLNKCVNRHDLASELEGMASELEPLLAAGIRRVLQSQHQLFMERLDAWISKHEWKKGATLPSQEATGLMSYQETNQMRLTTPVSPPVPDGTNPARPPTAFAPSAPEGTHPVGLTTPLSHSVPDATTCQNQRFQSYADRVRSRKEKSMASASKASAEKSKRASAGSHASGNTHQLESRAPSTSSAPIPPMTDKTKISAVVDTLWSNVAETKVERNIRSIARQCIEEEEASVEFRKDSIGSGHHEIASGKSLSSMEDILEEQGFLRRIVKGHFFELFFGLTIVSNSIWMGIEVDWVARRPLDQPPVLFIIVGYLYAFLFLTELVLRVAVDRSKFFCPEVNGAKQILWNYLDAFIVSTSVFEIALDIIAWLQASSQEESQNGEDDGGKVNTANLRIIRIIRVARLMRLFRIGRIVKFVRALRTLVFSIICTLKSVFWSMMLLIIIIYVFGILFTQAVNDYVVVIEFHPEMSLDPGVETPLLYHWGTLPDAMYTLFMTISGGVSYFDVAEPLRKLDTSWLIIFLSFITFTYFAVLNVVTGVFCQSAIESSKQDEEAMVSAIITNKNAFMARFRTLFNTIDSDGSGVITKAEFEEHLADTRVQAFFESMEVDAADALRLFRILTEADDDDGLEIEEFVMGCLRLKGYAKSCDIALLLHENKVIQKEIMNFATYVETRLEFLARK